MQKVDEKFDYPCTNELLQVRAYGQSYIDLGINIRSVFFFSVISLRSL
jgi:hypothetical protein